MTTHPLHHGRVELRGSGVASPEEKAPTQTPGLPETRDNNDTTLPSGPTRRRLLGWIAGGTGVAILSGIGGAEAFGGHHTNTGANHAPATLRHSLDASPTPLPSGDFDRYPKVFDQELTLDQIRAAGVAPFTGRTLDELAANLSHNLQYAVNTDREDIIQRVIDDKDGNMLPDVFKLRAEEIKNWRQIPTGTVPQDIDNPKNANFRGNLVWGFTMKVKDQLSPGDVSDPDVTRVQALVEITLGEMRPTYASGTPECQLEPPAKFDAHVWFSRNQGMDGFTQKRYEDGGWGWASADRMAEVGPWMRQHIPSNWDTVPDWASGPYY